MLFFFHLIVLARNSSTILNKSGESGHSSFVPDLRGNSFSFFPVEYDAGYKFFSYVAFTMLCYVPSILSFLRAFIMKECWILSMASSASIVMMM
jgi:hypothetical protein